MEALDKFNRDFKQYVGVGRAQSTYRKYDNVRKRLAEFLHEKLRREDIPLKELKETFITDYDLCLRGEKGLTPSCKCIYTKPLKMIVAKAHNAGIIARNPFAVSLLCSSSSQAFQYRAKTPKIVYRYHPHEKIT